MGSNPPSYNYSPGQPQPKPLDRPRLPPIQSQKGNQATSSAQRYQQHFEGIKQKEHELKLNSRSKPDRATYAGFAPYSVHQTPTKEKRKGGAPLKRILILGKSGHGKSSLGNLILGKDEFKVGGGMSATTSHVEWRETKLDSCTLRIYDTPDLKEYPQRKEMADLARDSFDLILYTVRADDRFSPEQQTLYQEMKSIFGAAFTNNLVVAVTFGDKLQGDINQFFNIPALQGVLGDARRRYIVFKISGSSTNARHQVMKYMGDSKKGDDDDVGSDMEFVHMSDVRGSEPSMRTETPTRTPPPRPPPPAASAPRGPPCVLVIGKTGNGKSSVCNMLLGEKRFKEGRGMSSTTTTAQCEQSNSPGGYSLKVVDTPDISASDISEDQRKTEFQTWATMTSSNPQAVLLAVRCDVRYTAEEYAIYRQLQHLIGKDFLTARLIVAFTFGDRLDISIEKEMSGQSPELQSVLRDAQMRYVVFNKKGKPDDIQMSVATLHSIMDSLGGHAGQATTHAAGCGRASSVQTAATRNQAEGTSQDVSVIQNQTALGGLIDYLWSCVPRLPTPFK